MELLATPLPMIKTKNDNPTLGSSGHILFGKVEVRMKAAPGTGIVSAIVLESNDLDEIDWKVLGRTPNNVQTNFFGKGDTSIYNHGQIHPVSASTISFHTYTVEWTSTAITWSVDGNTVRTLFSTDPSTSGGKNYPQSPCQIRIGNWPAGASPNAGTVAWAGGPTDFSKGPFSMYVINVNIFKYNPASSYTYGDNSGSWQSIKITRGSTSGNIKVGAGAVSAINNTTSATSTANSSGTRATSPSLTDSANSSVSRISTGSSRSTSAAAASSSATTSVCISNMAVRKAVNGLSTFIVSSVFLVVLSFHWL